MAIDCKPNGESSLAPFKLVQKRDFSGFILVFGCWLSAIIIIIIISFDCWIYLEEEEEREFSGLLVLVCIDWAC